MGRAGLKLHKTGGSATKLDGMGVLWQPMQYFGDASGTLNQVFSSNDIFSIAVVGGPPEHVGACPKRLKRKIGALDEIKWYELTGPNRRRILECIDDRDAHIQYAYATFTPRDLLTLEYDYLLFNELGIPIAKDVFIKSVFYSTLLDAVGVSGGNPAPEFYFDQLPQSEVLKQRLTEERSDIQPRWADSERREGVQAADCVAGAARHDRLKGDDWIERYLSADRAFDVTDRAHEALDAALENVSTEP